MTAIRLRGLFARAEQRGGHVAHREAIIAQSKPNGCGSLIQGRIMPDSAASA